MQIKLIGMKNFRSNLAFYTKKANKNNIQYIILKKNVPVLRVEPIDEKTFAFEKLAAEIQEARDQIKKGDIYTQAEIMKEFGLL